MSQGPLCPNLTQKVQKEVSQIANRNFSLVMLLGGLSVNLNHLKTIVFVTAKANLFTGVDLLLLLLDLSQMSIHETDITRRHFSRFPTAHLPTVHASSHTSLNMSGGP